MRTDVDVHDLPARLDEVIALAKAGQEVVVVANGAPCAKLIPVEPPRGARVPDLHPGAIVMLPGFDDPLSLEPDKAFAEPRPIGLRPGAIVLAPDFNDPLPDEFWSEGE